MTTASIEATMDCTRILECYLNNLPNGGIFIETKELFGLGDKIHLILGVPDLGCHVVATGQVAWHRRPRAWSSTLPSGIGFEFDTDSLGQRDYLLQFAKGELENRRIHGVRAMTEYPVQYLQEGAWVEGKTLNVSPGGLFVLTDTKPEIGSTLEANVHTDGTPEPTRCNLVVSWNRESGSYSGFGARFQRATPFLKKRFSTVPPAFPGYPNMGKGNTLMPGAPSGLRMTLPFEKK